MVLFQLEKTIKIKFDVDKQWNNSHMMQLQSLLLYCEHCVAILDKFYPFKQNTRFFVNGSVHKGAVTFLSIN